VKRGKTTGKEQDFDWHRYQKEMKKKCWPEEIRCNEMRPKKEMMAAGVEREVDCDKIARKLLKSSRQGRRTRICQGFQEGV